MSWPVSRLVAYLKDRPTLLTKVLRGLNLFTCEHPDCEKANDEVESLGRLVSNPEEEVERKLQQRRKVAHAAAQRSPSG